MEVTYPEPDHVVEYNILVLEKIKVKKADKPEVLSMTKLSQAIEESINHDGTIYEKATVLLRNLVKAHAFASGNRRTALITTKEFLIENGENFAVQDDEKNARVMQGIREDFYTQEDIAHWLHTGEIHEFKR